MSSSLFLNRLALLLVGALALAAPSERRHGSDEPIALAGFDIGRCSPKPVLVEAHARNKKALTEYFEGHGYEQIARYLEYDRTNWYFRPKAAAAD